MDSGLKISTFKRVLGVVMGTGFVCGGVLLAVFVVFTLRSISRSRDWPVAEGVVIRSEQGLQGTLKVPVVEYTYTVGGASYGSQQVSFGKPANSENKDALDAVLDRYPAGAKVQVRYDPNTPGNAVLEPGEGAPYYVLLLFAAVLLGCGPMAIVQGVRGTKIAPAQITNKRITVVTVAGAVLVYAAVIMATLGSDAEGVFVKAFGENPLGMPCMAFVWTLLTVLYLPMPWVMRHAMELVFQSAADRKWWGMGYIFFGAAKHPHLRRSRRIVIGGFLYFLVLMALWIWHTSRRGI